MIITNVLWSQCSGVERYHIIILVTGSKCHFILDTIPPRLFFSVHTSWCLACITYVISYLHHFNNEVFFHHPEMHLLSSGAVSPPFSPGPGSSGTLSPGPLSPGPLSPDSGIGKTIAIFILHLFYVVVYGGVVSFCV